MTAFFKKKRRTPELGKVMRPDKWPDPPDDSKKSPKKPKKED